MAIAECKHCKEDFIQFDSSPKDGVCRRPECRTKETIAALRAKLAEAERERDEAKYNFVSMRYERDWLIKDARRAHEEKDAANERVKALEEALRSLIRTCKAVLGLNGGYRQSSGVLRSAVERAALAAKEDGNAS